MQEELTELHSTVKSLQDQILKHNFNEDKNQDQRNSRKKLASVVNKVNLNQSKEG